MTTFKSIMVKEIDNDVAVELTTLTTDDLPFGEVLIRVAYSSINYKDGLASLKNGGVVGSYPMVLGIDLSGEVVASHDARFTAGQKVIVTSYDLGTNHFGGLSEFARVPADWVVPLPENLSLKEAMIFGTAGFTAALSIQKLQKVGLNQVDDNILVTGATGGVGAMSIAMLHQLGYQNITASSRKLDEQTFLTEIGANHLLTADEITLPKPKALAKQKWQFVIDPVGGEQVAQLLPQIHYLGAIALSGNAAGIQFATTVLPFILRGVQLIGIDSVFCPMPDRLAVWQHLATDYKPENLTTLINEEITLAEVPQVLKKILNSKMVGRTIVKISE